MKNTTPATVNHLTRLPVLGSLWAVLALVALTPSAFAANTADNYTGGVNGSFLTAGNWSLAALPAVTNDATFPVGSASGIRLFSAGSLTNGSFDNLCPSNTLSIRNETTTSTSSTLTLGGAGNLGNASAGANSGDLIYVVSGGTLNIIGPNGSTGSGVLNLVLGQSGNFDVIGSSTISSVISDGGSGYSITKTGAGTLTLSGTNTYTGATTISAGTLAIGGAGQLGGGTYSAAITNNSAFNYNSSAAQTLSGVVSGSGSLTNTGTGTLTLTASNTYTGATIVGGTGILQLQNPSAVPSASALTLNSGSTLSLQADADTAFTNASISSFSTSGNKYYIMVNSINAPAGNGHTLTLANASGGHGVQRCERWCYQHPLATHSSLIAPLHSPAPAPVPGLRITSLLT